MIGYLQRRTVFETGADLGIVESDKLNIEIYHKIVINEQNLAHMLIEPKYIFLSFSQAPIAGKHWKGVRDAFAEGPSSVQCVALFEEKKIIGEEDCLYLNIYVPEQDDLKMFQTYLIEISYVIYLIFISCFAERWALCSELPRPLTLPPHKMIVFYYI